MKHIIVALLGSAISMSALAQPPATSARLYGKLREVNGKYVYSYRLVKPVTSRIGAVFLGMRGRFDEMFLNQLPQGVDDTWANIGGKKTPWVRTNPKGWKSNIFSEEDNEKFAIKWDSPTPGGVGFGEITGFSVTIPTKDDAYINSKSVIQDGVEYTAIEMLPEVSTPFPDKSFALSAKKKFSPNANEPSEMSLDADVFFAIPSTIPVTVGNGGNGQSVLKFRPAGQTSEISCTYKGGSSVAKPVSPEDISAGKEYRLVKCSDGRVAGDIATAGWIKLEIKGAVNGGKKSVVQADFEVVPLK